MSTKTVKFRRDSPSGGSSYLDHQRSDSGVGSFSDSESRATYPDRDFAGSDYDSPGLFQLQDALANETSAKERWMKKALDLDKLLSDTNKALKETEARLRALEDHVDALGDEKAKLAKTNKELNEENAQLKEELKEFTKDSKDEKRSSRRKSNSPPVMSGALPTDKDEKPRRSASKRHSIRDTERAERDKERERIRREMEKELEREKEREKEREMDRLRKRFNSRAGDESDAKSNSNTSSKSQRSRRDSYVEPLGPAASRPQVQVPQSPSRPPYPYQNQPYSSQPYPPPSSSGRPVHPQVVVSYSDAFHDQEDGLYHAHPLPKQQQQQQQQQRSPDRRERR